LIWCFAQTTLAYDRIEFNLTRLIERWPNHAIVDEQHAQDAKELTQCIKKYLEYVWKYNPTQPRAATHTTQHFESELPIWLLDVLYDSGYYFCPTMPFDVVKYCNVDVLMWMIAQGFGKAEEYPWDVEGMITSLGYTKCEDMSLVETIVDMIYDHSPPKDKFPTTLFLENACSNGWGGIRDGKRNKLTTKLAEWFLSRGQYRYPMAKISTDRGIGLLKDAAKYKAAGQIAFANLLAKTVTLNSPIKSSL